jgi:hypothetical protein
MVLLSGWGWGPPRIAERLMAPTRRKRRWELFCAQVAFKKEANNGWSSDFLIDRYLASRGNVDRRPIGALFWLL